MTILFALHSQFASCGGAHKAAEMAVEKGHVAIHGLQDDKKDLESGLKRGKVDVLFLRLGKETCEHIQIAKNIYPEIFILGLDPGWFLGHEIQYSTFVKAGINDCVPFGDPNLLRAMEHVLKKFGNTNE